MEGWLSGGGLQPPDPMGSPQPQLPPQPQVTPPPQPMPMPMKNPMAGAAGSMLGNFDTTSQNYLQSSMNAYDAQQEAARQRSIQEEPLHAQNRKAYEDNIAARDEQRVMLMERAEDIRKRTQAFAAQDIQPFRLVQNKETWEKVALGISMAIGGFLNPRGRNHVADLILEYVDRDIGGQKADQQRKGAALDAERADNAQALQASRQEFMEKEERRLTLLELAKKEMDIAAAKQGNPAAAALRDQYKAELEMKIHEKRMDFAKGLLNYDLGLRQVGLGYGQLAQRKEEMKQNIVQHQFDRNMDLAQTAMREKRYGVTGGRNYLPVVAGGELIGYVPKASHDDATKWLMAKDAAAATAEALILSQSKRDWWADRPDLLARIGLGSNAHLEASQLYGQLVKHVRVIEGSGKNWTGNEEQNVYRQITPGAGGWFQENPTVRLKSFIESLDIDEDRLKGTMLDDTGQPAYPGIGRRISPAKSIGARPADFSESATVPAATINPTDYGIEDQ